MSALPVPAPADGPVTLPGALLAALADLVLPLACAGCGLVGERWCAACRAPFHRAGTRAVPGLPPVVVLAPYTGPARATVLAYKERGRRDLAVPLAGAVASALQTTGLTRRRGPVALVPAPSRRSAARARGGDHMVLLARALARSPAAVGDLRLARALALRAGARDSVGLGPAERAENLARHLRVRQPHLPPPGTPVLLLDDVLTTGATARAATVALSRVGCPVAAVVVLTAAPRHRQRNAVRGFTRPDETVRPPPSVRGVIRSGETGERHLPDARRSHYRGPPHSSTRDGRCARSDPAAPGAPAEVS